MDIKDFLLTRDDVTRASIWKDDSGQSRIHTSNVEISDRISILASMKTIDVIISELSAYFTNGEAGDFISKLISKKYELSVAYDKAVGVDFNWTPGWKRIIDGKIYDW
jgi:hypothetical protein